MNRTVDIYINGFFSIEKQTYGGLLVNIYLVLLFLIDLVIVSGFKNR